ncbi:MAG: DUF2249 domain-containing protein [Ginsengibacter sp.]
MNMIINADTKIAKILRQNPDALEAIISITPKFEKLRNPLLRKLMAGRTSIGMASKVSGCDVDEFFKKLAPLGFEIDKATPAVTHVEKPPLPSFFHSLKPTQIIEFDVRPIIDADEDPLPLIVKKVKEIQPGEALKIINSFEPTPLLSLLKKQGFDSYVDTIDDHQVDTYFYRTGNTAVIISETENIAEGWDDYIKKFAGKLQTIDVRQLEMPGPMMAILDALESLPPETALFVYHKRIPVFLLPELKEKKFDYRIKEIANNEVHLLIFKE